jgi:hypothetical protein
MALRLERPDVSEWSDMSLELLDAHPIPGGMSITFATERGLEPLTGSCEQVAQLAKAMREVSALAPLGNSDRMWLEDVVVGDDVVRLGINPEGQARLRIDRAAAARDR